eukprot:6865871-Heterocapsa_arctica.AAC.1
MAVPQGWSGYIHKNCCSRCTNTGGYAHTRRCRDKNMWARWNNDPYKINRRNENYNMKDEPAWDPQTWQQQGWEAQDWTENGQEYQEEEEVEPEEEEETYDENGKRIQKEKT